MSALRSRLVHASCPWLLLLVLILGVSVVAATPAGAGAPNRIHLSLEAPAGPVANGPLIPPNCSAWHELWPIFCQPHHQDGYHDNDGDGMISPCDEIILNHAGYHVVWVGPTYHMSRVTPPGSIPFIAEPFSPELPGESPVCEIWQEIYPNFGRQFHVDSWHDNGNGVLDVCDEIDEQNSPGVPPAIYHIDRISVDIIIEFDPTATVGRSWGAVKKIYHH